MGYGYIWGAWGVAEGLKMPEFDKIADFGPFWGTVDPLKIVSQ